MYIGHVVIKYRVGKKDEMHSIHECQDSIFMILFR